MNCGPRLLLAHRSTCTVRIQAEGARNSHRPHTRGTRSSRGRGYYPNGCSFDTPHVFGLMRVGALAQLLPSTATQATDDESVTTGVVRKASRCLYCGTQTCVSLVLLVRFQLAALGEAVVEVREVEGRDHSENSFHR